MRLRGASFLEAIVAIFILAGGTLSCCSLLIQAFRFQERRQYVSEATLVAEQSLEAVRDWALIPANYDSAWTTYSGVDLPPVGAAGYVAHIEVSPPKAYTGLTPGYREVTVGVRRSTHLLAEVSGQVASPLRTPANVIVEPVVPTTNLAVNATLQYSARLLDASGQEVPGVNFLWSVESQAGPTPPPGMGSIQRISAHEARLTHSLVPGPGHQPGGVLVKARCRYRNRIFAGDSAPLELNP